MGFVKIPHDLLDWQWYGDKNTVYAYLNLLLEASWGESVHRGVHLKRGQVVTTYPEIAKKCGISASQARTIIQRLKATGKIAVKITPKYSIITMLEYSFGENDVSQSNR